MSEPSHNSIILSSQEANFCQTLMKHGVHRDRNGISEGSIAYENALKDFEGSDNLVKVLVYELRNKGIIEGSGQFNHLAIPQPQVIVRFEDGSRYVNLRREEVPLETKMALISDRVREDFVDRISLPHMASINPKYGIVETYKGADGVNYIFPLSPEEYDTMGFGHMFEDSEQLCISQNFFIPAPVCDTLDEYADAPYETQVCGITRIEKRFVAGEEAQISDYLERVQKIIADNEKLQVTLGALREQCHALREQAVEVGKLFDLATTPRKKEKTKQYDVS